MDMPTSDFVRACSLAELKAKGRLVLHGRHSPILVVYDGGRVFALDNRCPHMGFPLDRGSVEDGILTCHWHHARFDLASGCTFDLWADDVPTCPVEVRDGEVWIKPSFGHGDAVAPLARSARRRPCPQSRACDRQGRAGTAHGRRARAGDPAAGGVVRRPEPRWLGNRRDHPHRARQPAPRAAGRGDLSRALPRRPAGRGGLRRRGAATGARPAREPARSLDAPALAPALERRAPSRSRRTHPAHRHRELAPRRPRSRACCSRRRRTAPSPTAATRSTSSTRLASAST